MTKEDTEKESFEDLRKSFFYGSRSNLSFKFLADLTDEAAGLFLQDLFKQVVTAIDTQDVSDLKSCLAAGQIQGYKAHLKSGFDYDEGPFTPLPGPLSELKLTLLTSSGHFLEGEDPNPLGVKNMTQKEAEARIFDFLKEEPVLTGIPFDCDPGKLRVRHGGYDVSGAIKDPNVSLPIAAMKALKVSGRFRSLTKKAYSFVGACSQKHLLKNALPKWIDRIKRAGTQAVILVPV
ncbi:MAG: glycine/betaine/sarcosine/D-proline family reductase selenoprotein B [Desulfobacterales bacterium]|nr:glycine/betaine/sarcosine/D-proline family reductase selenoprotein B [Desulfobacterales bacterium]